MNFSSYQCENLKGEEEVHSITKEDSSVIDLASSNSQKFHDEDAEITQQYLDLLNKIDKMCLNLVKCNKKEKDTVEDKFKKHLFYYLNQINLKKIILNTEKDEFKFENSAFTEINNKI
jgi:hypothetical protein